MRSGRVAQRWQAIDQTQQSLERTAVGLDRGAARGPLLRTGLRVGQQPRERRASSAASCTIVSAPRSSERSGQLRAVELLRPGQHRHGRAPPARADCGRRSAPGCRPRRRHRPRHRSPSSSPSVSSSSTAQSPAAASADRRAAAPGPAAATDAAAASKRCGCRGARISSARGCRSSSRRCASQHDRLFTRVRAARDPERRGRWHSARAAAPRARADRAARCDRT